MPTTDQIRDVLREIDDPELHRSIVELGMVKGVEITGGLVTVDLALTIPGCPLKSYFQEVLPARIKAEFQDVSDVQINLGAMTEEERSTLVGGIRKETVSPFQRSDSTTTVIAVGSGKGGVGKSTVTVNLAAALAKAGHSVGLMDADVWGFSIPRMLGNTNQPTVIPSGDDQIWIPLEAYGMKTISIGNLIDETKSVIWRGPMLHKLIQQFLSTVHWGEPDYLLIDMPPGTGDVAISLTQFLPDASFVVVTTPQQAAEKVAERAANMMVKQGLNMVGVIENMSYSVCDHCDERTYPFGSGGGKELADRFNIPLLGQVPLDPPMRDFSDHGKPAVISLPESPSARVFVEIAGKLVDIQPPKPKGSRKDLPLIIQPASGNGHAHQHSHG